MQYCIAIVSFDEKCEYVGCFLSSSLFHNLKGFTETNNPPCKANIRTTTTFSIWIGQSPLQDKLAASRNELRAENKIVAVIKGSTHSFLCWDFSSLNWKSLNSSHLKISLVEIVFVSKYAYREKICLIWNVTERKILQLRAGYPPSSPFSA